MRDPQAVPPGYDLWSQIPVRYNAGRDLTDAHGARGRGRQVALYWENSAGEARALTFWALSELTNRFANALAALGVARGDRILLRVPNIP
jgi:acyl-coenzyme A synthetase/AMP-(fatty) acid ligase